MKYFHDDSPFELESGAVLPGITIAYQTYGKQNPTGSNTVWVCHALTANAEAADWWPGVIGENGCIHPEDYYIVCANIIGSCYGSSGPLSNNPGSPNQPYYADFPMITIRGIW